MSDILGKLADLYKQATTEQSHYYVASCCKEAMTEIARLTQRVVELEDQRRWNIERIYGGLRICEGGHARSGDCEWIEYVPHARLAECERLLDEASPRQECDGCGREFRWHQMFVEEGDRWECAECWDRCEKAERAAMRDRHDDK